MADMLTFESTCLTATSGRITRCPLLHLATFRGVQYNACVFEDEALRPIGDCKGLKQTVRKRQKAMNSEISKLLLKGKIIP